MLSVITLVLICILWILDLRISRKGIKHRFRSKGVVTICRQKYYRRVGMCRVAVRYRKVIDKGNNGCL